MSPPHGDAGAGQTGRGVGRTDRRPQDRLRRVRRHLGNGSTSAASRPWSWSRTVKGFTGWSGCAARRSWWPNSSRTSL